MMTPAFEGYFADPFILRVEGNYFAYGGSGAAASGERVIELLESSDLITWQSCGPVLQVVDAQLGDEYWAPEVLPWGGYFWMFYSVGTGIASHHIRVARAQSARGPFIDQRINLTPDESFAIDAHPFIDDSGALFLYFARDVIDFERPGTHLACIPLENPTRPGGVAKSVLQPYADWQIYERDRAMYDGHYDWHTLEGPSVVYREGRYWMTYSGGAWTGPGYAVSWAVADSPLGPWLPAPPDAPALLATSNDYLGPGHNSLTVDPSGNDVIAFHAWDASWNVRQLHLRRITFRPEGPRVDGPIRGLSVP